MVQLRYIDKVNLLNAILNKFGMEEGIGRYCYFNQNWDLVSIFDPEYIRTLDITRAKAVPVQNPDSLKLFREYFPNYTPGQSKIITIYDSGNISLAGPNTIDEILEQNMNEMTGMDLVEIFNEVLLKR